MLMLLKRRRSGRLLLIILFQGVVNHVARFQRRNEGGILPQPRGASCSKHCMLYILPIQTLLCTPANRIVLNSSLRPTLKASFRRQMSALPFTRLKAETELAVLSVLRACRL